MSIISDEEIVRNFFLGDESAFPILLDRYLKPILNFINQMVGNYSVAEDLTQETFFKAWKNLGRFEQNKKFKTWLFTIAKNTAFDHLRKKKSIPFAFFVDKNGRNYLEETLEEKTDLMESVEQKQLKSKMEKAINKLPVIYRAILFMHYKEGFSLKEISEIIGKPYNTVKSRYKRGVEYLRKFYEE